MWEESQEWNKARGNRLRTMLVDQFETIPDARLVLSALLVAEPEQPLEWVKKAIVAVRSQRHRKHKLEALAKLLPRDGGVPATGIELQQNADQIENTETSPAGPKLRNWLNGGGKDRDSISLKWQNRLAWLCGLERDAFLEKISASMEAAEIPTSKPTPSKAEAWTAGLLATELMFPKIGRSPVNAKRFYEGWPATPSELAADCDFRRTFQSKDNLLTYAALTKKIVSALKDAAAKRRIPVFLFTGPGGAGKTTVLERIGFDLTQIQDFKVGVLRIRKWKRRIDAKDILCSDCNKAFKGGNFKVVALFLDEAAAQSDGIKSLIELAHRQHFKICLFLADQTNKRGSLPKDVDEFTLGRLGDDEINELLNRLEKFDCLGVLQEKTREERLDLFRSERRCDKQLLVVLREITSGKRFDTIIFEEWEQIPSDRGKDLYLFAAILHSVGAYLPEEAARRAFRCLKEPLVWHPIRNACREIVCPSHSFEHGIGTVLKARHPIIAEALVHARFLERHIVEDANDFAEIAEEVLNALDAMRNEQNKRSVYSLVRQLVLSKAFADCLAAATDIKRLCEAMSCFDEVWEGQHNNFFIQAYHAWKKHGAPTLADALLEEAVVLGRGGVACLGWCVGHFADRLIQTKSPEQIVRGIQHLHRLMADYEMGKTPNWLPRKISALYDAAGDKDLAIQIFEDQFSKASDEDSSGRGHNGIALSQLFERRYLEKDDPQDLKRAAQIVKDLLEDERIRGSHGALVARYAQLVQVAEYQEHIDDLNSAIEVVEKVLATLKNQTEGDPATAAMALSHLFEQRFLEKHNPQDLKRAAQIVIDLLEDERVRGRHGDLVARYAQLVQVAEYQEHIDDLNSAIEVVEKVLATLKNQTEGDPATAAMALSHLFEQRFLEKHNPQDLKRAAQIVIDLLEDERVRGRHGDLVARYAQLVQVAEYQEHIDDLNSAIEVVEKVLATMKNQTEGDPATAAMALSHLFEQRFLEKHNPQDLKRAAQIVIDLLEDERVRGRHGDLVARYAQLVQVAEYQEHIDDLNSAIEVVEKVLATLKNQTEGDPATAAVALSHLFEQRFLEKRDERDLLSAQSTLREFHHDLRVRGQLKLLVERFPELAQKDSVNELPSE